MFDDAAARRYLAGLAPAAPGSVRWLIYDQARQWVSVIDTELAALRRDCAHVLSTLPEKDPDASLAAAIREFLAAGADRAPHVIALSCAVLMQSTGDREAVFTRIQSGVMATLVESEAVVIRPIAA